MSNSQKNCVFAGSHGTEAAPQGGTDAMQDEVKTERFNLNAIEELGEFDPAEFLTSEESIAAYLNEFLEDEDSSMLTHALGTAARAKGMTTVARESGLARESLYKALRADSSPRFDTVVKVMKAFGVRLIVQPIQKAREDVL